MPIAPYTLDGLLQVHNNTNPDIIYIYLCSNQVILIKQEYQSSLSPSPSGDAHESDATKFALLTYLNNDPDAIYAACKVRRRAHSS